MKIPLSSRLMACAGFVAPGERVADVGCDHGYLGIYLLSKNIASFVIAADINAMPLQSAMQNAEKFGFADKMSFHLSDGVQSIPRNFDTLICAGMGADTMISILTAAPWLKNTAHRLILQCQSKTPMLRQFLSENGWYISDETALRDGRFLYTIMEVIWQPDNPRLTPAQCYFPPALLNRPTEALYEYYKWVAEGLRIQAERRNDFEKQQLLKELESILPELLSVSEEPT